MESKHSNNSETSSEENDDQHHHQPAAEKFNDENSSGGGRFYECNFCKRGFTNAQALGGHMNIHRKEKAKAKKQMNIKAHEKSSNSFSNKSSEECVMPRYYESISSDQAQFYAVHRPMVGHVNNYHQFYFPASNPNFSLVDHHFPAAPRRPENLSLFEDHYDPRMSLRIEQPHNENLMEDELDLELRLG